MVNIKQSLPPAILSIITIGVVVIFQAPFVPGRWYESLIKPSLNPPNWLFGVVWPILYILIAISLYVWLKTRNTIDTGKRKHIDTLWFINLVTNALFSPITFGLERLGLGAFVVTLVATTTAALVYSLQSYTKIGSWLLVPYLLWTSFATYLAISLSLLN